MQLSQWLVADFDDAVTRLHTQVLARVSDERRLERPGGGNSILWVHFHIARHAALALSVLTAGSSTGAEPSGQPNAASKPGSGLTEAEQPWGAGLSAAAVDKYSTEVGTSVRAWLSALSAGQLADIPDTEHVLETAGIPRDEFRWLYGMWSGQDAAFFVRWPIIGHLVSHVGEMMATRNRMGLSPF